MTTETKILEAVAQMLEALKQEIIHYSKYLIENYSQNKVDQEDVKQLPSKRGGFGILKGKIWMADDFDEPLKDLKNICSP
ncbi:hypothetical protein GFS31_30840 [Leptolyngbya sp. BL0902]|uniref:type II toxin-antitoxin system VapB family antitoxin n=1 Tax=Leptolyngbya sp. BL0902 TaxID=1115757 RepID=UPI0018E82756|nr:DUF2281 domain-containing protein [Leptolyngbya sp. BL0902]QQE66386.1 hypothetical protein GFS31_30840 [Leptolyngbya sp. BL0902]